MWKISYGWDLVQTKTNLYQNEIPKLSEMIVRENLVAWSLSIQWRLLQTLIWKLPKATPFQIKIYRKYKKYIENISKKIYSLWLYYIAFSSTNLLWNKKLVINIRFTWNHSISQSRNLWLSAIKKNEFLRIIYFSAIKCETSLKFLQTFITIGDDMTLCQCIFSLASQISLLEIEPQSFNNLSSWCSRSCSKL